jgi:hypothetical protein
VTVDLTKPLQFDCCDNAAFQIHDGKWQIAVVKLADPDDAPYYEDVDGSRAYAMLFAASPELLEIAKRHRHLLSELHGGNAFSKDHLWQELAKTNETIAKASPTTHINLNS